MTACLHIYSNTNLMLFQLEMTQNRIVCISTYIDEVRCIYCRNSAAKLTYKYNKCSTQFINICTQINRDSGPVIYMQSQFEAVFMAGSLSYSCAEY